MKILHTERNVHFMPVPNAIYFVLDDLLPPAEQITSALGLFFYGDRLLMTQLQSRGWDIPGGHLEPGETPEQAVRREVLEETGADLGSLSLLGYQKMHIFAAKPEEYKYPYPESYQTFYCGRVTHLHPFTATPEALDRGLYGPDEVDALAWIQRHRPVYEAACASVFTRG